MSRKWMRIGLLLLGLLAAERPVRAAFEDIGAGARPTGMGSAFIAVADDANTVYYNPAGLGQLRHPQLTAGYGMLSLGLTDNSSLGHGALAVTAPLKDGRWGTLGAGILDLQLAGAYREDSFSLSYGRALAPSLLGGVSVKWLRRGFGADAYTAVDPLFQRHGRTVSATSLDLGLLYRYSRHYVFALAAKDVNRPDVGLGEEDRVPAAWKGAFAYYQRAFVASTELTSKAGELGLSIGGERWFLRHRMAGRGGLDFGSSNKRNLALGASLRMGNAQVDYGFLLPLASVADTAGSHRLSLTLRFGGPAAGPVALLEQEEILGASDAEMARMRDEMERIQREAQISQDETEKMRARMADLEAQVQTLREAKPQLSPAPAPTASPSSPGDLLNPAVEQMEREIQRLKGELEKRSRAKPQRAAPAKTEFKRPGLYTVREGDTLRTIAAKTLGDPDRWVEIFQANRDRIKRGGEVAPGQTLIIP